MIKVFSTITGKLVAVVQIVALTLLASCTAVGGVVTPLTVCHATGDAGNPYETITVTSAELTEHLTHPDDISPVPAAGCPTYLLVVTDGEIMFCHANGNEIEPYDEIMVSVNGLSSHADHEGDVFPISEEEGCPATLALTSDKITICHNTGSTKNPYNLITVSVNGLNGHGNHEGDIIPAPAGGCPVTQP